MSSFDIGMQQAGEQNLQNSRIKEQQRVQQQNTVGAQLLDAINNASNIKPQTKDENGNIIHNPEYDTAQTNKVKLLQQYTQLNSPEQHASFAQHLHGLIFGKPTPHAQQPALSPNSSPVQPTPDPNAPPAAAAPAAPPAPLHPMAPAPPDHPLHAITKGIGELGSAIKNHAAAFANPLPAPTQPDPALIAKYYKDPKEVEFERNKELYGVRGQYQVDAAKARGMMARPVHMGDVTPQDAIKNMHTLGYIYAQEDGTPYTEAQLAELPNSFRIGEFRQGQTTYAKAYDQKAGHVGVGGIEYAVYPLGEQGPQTMTALGNQTADKTTMHQVPGMNPGEVIDLHGAQAPVRTGMAGATPPSQASPIAGTSAPEDVTSVVPQTTPPPTLKVRPQPTTPPTLPPSPSQAAITAKANAGRSQSRQIPTPTGAPMPPPFAKGTMLVQGRAAQPVVSAMSVVGANIFGTDGEKPIWDNAWMYDKPELRKALNNALTLNALKNPGTEDNPTLMQSLATAVGATQWTQEQVNQAAVQARQEVERLGGPEALKQFAREAAMQEDLPALRAATKASAAQGSLALAVRAAPVYNIASSQDFRNQLGTLLSTAVSGMRGYPAINPEYVKWWDRGVSAAKGGPVSANAPKVPSGNQPIVQQSPSTGKFRYSTDGGKSWQPGQPPQ